MKNKKTNTNKITRTVACFLLIVFAASMAVSCSELGLDLSPENSSASSSGRSESRAPVVTGGDIEVEPGGSVDYLSLVEVSTYDGKPATVRVDSLGVDTSLPGVYPVNYIVTDQYGTTEYTLYVTVRDVTPPVVTGNDFAVVQGSSVSYKKQITVIDDSDSDPNIAVNTSLVDLDTPGTYAVTYTVTDRSGNETVYTLHITVLAQEGGEQALEKFAEMQEYVKVESQFLLNQITDDSMTDLQKAYAIYYWTKKHIAYSGESDKSNYIVGAYDGIKTRRGDCYTYFSVAKSLLEAAGIANVDVVKERINEKQSRHYWSLVNVGDGWYHFDSTPYKFDEDNFFMVTEAELKAWDDKYYPYCHNYLPEGLPELSTESIQYMVNYNSSKLIG